MNPASDSRTQRQDRARRSTSKKKSSRSQSVDSHSPDSRSARANGYPASSVSESRPSNQHTLRRAHLPSTWDGLSGGGNAWSKVPGQEDSWTGHFNTGDDFVAFGPSSEDEEEPPSRPQEWGREWDRGKVLDGDGQSGHGKRRRDEDNLDRNDGYASKKQRVDAASRKAPWAGDVNWESCSNVAEMFHLEVEAFIRYISPTPIEHEVRSMTIQFISNVIRKVFPDASIQPFGSFETKLYLPLGDIDLVIQSDYMAYSDKVSVLKSLANIVRRAGITDRVTIIAKAKVPIIKFVTSHGRLSVDISINQMNGVAAGKMVNRFLDEMPALRGLVLVTKSFLNQRSMNEVFSGGLGSYSIVCLAVSFLQMHPKIRRGEIDPSHNLGVLVMEFFELYGYYFNYEKTGISIRHGGSYFSKVRRGWYDHRKTNLLSIEDPGDTTNDISRGSFSIGNVRQTFAGAYEIMTAAAYLRAGIISARRQGQYVNLRSNGYDRDHLNPTDMSVLSSVMGVTQETINHRRLVQEVYDKGTLHHLLGISPQRGVPSLHRMANGTAAPSPTRKLADAQSSGSAYEADMDLGSDQEQPPRLYDRAKSESRYDIESAQPARNHIWTDKPQVSHTVFTTDDENDDDDIVGGGVIEKEDSFNSTTDRRAKKPIAIDRKRAYWASKGIGAEGNDDS